MRSVLGRIAPIVIAEISANHNGSLDRAIQLIEAAKDAGVDGVKLQTYTPESMTLNLDRDMFRISDPKSPWNNASLYELYRRGETPWTWHEIIFKRARELGLLALSTPFDAAAVDRLESLDVPAYKIASFEIVDLPLIEKAAQTKKPLIISTGMATLDEIDEAVRTARGAGAAEVILLKCTSTYPSSPQESNLRTIPHLEDAFDCPVGLSDHTLGIGVSVAAVAFGAVLVEKHLTLDRGEGGIDAEFSLEPPEMRALVEEIRRAHAALGRVSYGPTPSEQRARALRRSLYIVSDVDAGDVLSETNVRAIRPGGGLPPKYMSVVVGRRVREAVPKGTPVTWDLLS